MPLILRVELFPEDLDRFVDFYVRVLRFSVADDRRHDGYVSVHRDAVQIGAVRAWRSVDRSGRAVPTGTELVLETDDVAADHAHVVATGWPIESDLEAKPWGLSDFRIYDPDGYYIRITSRS